MSLEESPVTARRSRRLLKRDFPDEIEAIWSRVGTPEVATDPMGLEVTDIFISLTSREQWKRAKTQDAFVKAMAELTKNLPGMRAVYTQPIEMRINEMVAGIRADVGIKVYGDDLEVLKEKAARTEQLLKEIPAVRGCDDRAGDGSFSPQSRSRSGPRSKWALIETGPGHHQSCRRYPGW